MITYKNDLKVQYLYNTNSIAILKYGLKNFNLLYYVIFLKEQILLLLIISFWLSKE